jgi:hypothetical protein
MATTEILHAQFNQPGQPDEVSKTKKIGSDTVESISINYDTTFEGGNDRGILFRQIYSYEGMYGLEGLKTTLTAFSNPDKGTLTVIEDTP